MKKFLLVVGTFLFVLWLSPTQWNSWFKERAATLTFVGGSIAVLSYLLSVQVAQGNSRRAAVQLAANECRTFGTQIIPDMQDLWIKVEKAGCDFAHFEVIRTEEQIRPQQRLLTDQDRAALTSQRTAITKTLNSVESFAIPFCEGVAATDVGFRECGRGFVWMFEQYFPLFSTGDLKWYYPSTQHLYWLWRRKFELVDCTHALRAEPTAANLGRWRKAVTALLKERWFRRYRRAAWEPISHQPPATTKQG